ncbi:hypothetical protein WG915_04695 [Corynebacterium sp. H128]|uniref:hypothetical protein n=1 Tax=unclassified Corynebacterium TaxID=2624378 RepID=UPI0030ACEC1F
MLGTGVRKEVGMDLSGLSRQERIVALRTRMEAVGAAPAPEVTSADVLPVPRGLDLQLARQMVCQVSDTPAFIVELIRAVVADNNFVAIVGWPELLLAELQCGLERIVAVPDPGPDPLNTVAVLTEGMDLVLYRTEVPLELSPVRARPLLGKLRKSHAVLLLVNVRVSSPQLSITARVSDYQGIGPGVGRIRGMNMTVHIVGKTGVTTQSLTVGSVSQKPQLRVV